MPRHADVDTELDARLAAAMPVPPGHLADAIMRRVAAAAHAERRRRARLVGGAAGVVALAAAAMLILWRPQLPAPTIAWHIESPVAGSRPGPHLSDGQEIDVLAGGETQLVLDDSRAVRLMGEATAIVHHQELQLVRGRARIRGRVEVFTTRAQVVGTSDDTELELSLDPPDDKENEMMSPKLTMALAATAGAVLTVAVLHGHAEVRADDAGTTTALAAPDRLVLPPATAVALAAGPRVESGGPPDGPHARVAGSEPTPNQAGPDCPPSDCQGDECSHCALVVPDDSDDAVAVSTSGPSAGRTDACVTIVEYSDYACPFCEQALSTVHQLIDLYPRDVRIVLKSFPLAHHDNAELAAEAALAADDQGKFWEMHDILLANQGALDRASLEAYAAAIGLDLALFRAALDDHRHADDIARDLAEGEKAGIHGIPSFVINGHLVVGNRPLADLQAMVAAELVTPPCTALHAENAAPAAGAAVTLHVALGERGAVIFKLDGAPAIGMASPTRQDLAAIARSVAAQLNAASSVVIDAATDVPKDSIATLLLALRDAGVSHIVFAPAR